jgi:MFS family permease
MFSGYSRNFWLMSVAMFLFMTSFNLILPELNDFITLLGGEDQKGLIITLFTISAAISRPYSGKLADHIGRKKVMIFGIGISLIISLLYPLVLSVGFFLVLRFLHGFSVGFMPTGATALITDILPEDRRGQGMGIWGTFTSLGIGVGQSLGSFITMHLGLDNLFLFATGFTAISALLVGYVRETLQNRQKFSSKQLIIDRQDIMEPSVLPAAMVMLLTAPASGIIFILTPDMSKFMGIPNKGWFLGIYVISTILIRLFTGTLSDKIGRRKTLTIGTVILIISLIYTGLSNEFVHFTLSSLLFGVATGIMSPTLFAWTADLSPSHRRGVGTGTMFIALEIGIMIGSSSTILTYDSTPETVFAGFSVGVVLAVAALLYLLWHQKYRHSDT